MISKSLNILVKATEVYFSVVVHAIQGGSKF